jgi:hypothetical protein
MEHGYKKVRAFMMKHGLTSGLQADQVHEWVEAYRQWNEQKLIQRQVIAGQRSIEERLMDFLELSSLWGIG